MTHPWTLHAGANLWSLRRSWPQLLAAQKAATAAAAEDGDRGTLQAWRPGGGHHSGQGEGICVALDAGLDAEAKHWARLVERVRGHVDQAYWLAVSNLGRRLDGHGQLARILAAIPHVDCATARDIAAELAAADQVCRKALRLPPDHWPLPDNPPCPCCGVRMLRAQTAACDTAAWTVVCTAGCRCLGEDCGCGMPVRVRGVGHIWDRSAGLVAEQMAGLRVRRVRDGCHQLGGGFWS